MTAVSPSCCHTMTTTPTSFTPNTAAGGGDVPAPTAQLAAAIDGLAVAVQGLGDAVAALAAAVQAMPTTATSGAAAVQTATSPQSLSPATPVSITAAPLTTSTGGGGAGAAPIQAEEPDEPASSGTSAERERLLDIARAEIGVSETGGEDIGDRINDYRQSTRGYDGHGTSWCADFASWVFNEYGAPLVDDNGDPWTVKIAEWAKGNGRWSEADATPRPGDLMFFKNPGGNPYFVNHVAIVERVDPDGRIHTIGGNESDRVKRDSYPPGHDRTVGFVSAGLP